MSVILAGDIGGTKTNLALFSSQTGPDTPLMEQTLRSADYTSLEELVNTFLAQTNQPIQSVCFGVAGPVVDGRAQLTNLPWLVDEEHLRTTLQCPAVHLLNDLEAIAYAVPALESSHLHTLNAGEKITGGHIAIIAPGTGLGEALLLWNGSEYRPYPSEGGHASFAPTNETELELLRYLWQHFTHVSYERVCSGIGIPNIYAFLKDSGYAEESPHVAEKLATASDPTPVIVNAALSHEAPCPLAEKTLKLFISILGAEASNLALKILATGGVYLGGGIPPRILSALDGGTFMQAFQRKGRFTTMLQRVPVHIILNSKAALLGAARRGLMDIMAEV